MRTGIRFFDEHEFQPGNLIVIVGFANSGKTMVSTALAVGFAQQVGAEKRLGGQQIVKDRRIVAGRTIDTTVYGVIHLNPESTYESWRQRCVQIAGGKMPALRYRNTEEGLFLPYEFGNATVVLDHIGLLTAKDNVHELARVAKLYAVRQKTCVVVTAQVNTQLGRQILAEGWVDPMKLPEWVLEFGDQIFLVSHSNATFSVTDVKSKGILRSKPDRSCFFTLEPEGFREWM